VRLLVPLTEELRVLLLLLEALPVPLLEAELLGLAPSVREAEALALTVLEALRVLEEVSAALPVPELLEVQVCEGEGVAAAVLLLLRELLPEIDGEEPLERDAVALADTVLLAL